MYSVTNIEFFNELIEKYPDKLIGIFLMSSMDINLLRLVTDSWVELNRRTGHNTHFIVTTRYAIDDCPSQEKYESFDFELSSKLQEMYGIPNSKTPCIVFDSGSHTSGQYSILLSNNIDEVRRTIHLIFDFINSNNYVDTHSRAKKLLS